MNGTDYSEQCEVKEVISVVCLGKGLMTYLYDLQNGQVETNGVKIWRLVLTGMDNFCKFSYWRFFIKGGPCGGKTTAQNRLATFFESLGWRVFRVPETATILLNGGVNKP